MARLDRIASDLRSALQVPRVVGRTDDAREAARRLGVAGRIQVTGRVVAALRDSFVFEERGVVNLKGKGDVAAYFLLGPRAA